MSWPGASVLPQLQKSIQSIPAWPLTSAAGLSWENGLKLEYAQTHRCLIEGTFPEGPIQRDSKAQKSVFAPALSPFKSGRLLCHLQFGASEMAQEMHYRNKLTPALTTPQFPPGNIWVLCGKLPTSFTVGSPDAMHSLASVLAATVAILLSQDPGPYPGLCLIVLIQ